MSGRDLRHRSIEQRTQVTSDWQQHRGSSGPPARAARRQTGRPSSVSVVVVFSTLAPRRTTSDVVYCAAAAALLRLESRPPGKKNRISIEDAFDRAN